MQNAVFNPTEVVVGSKINGFFLSIFIIGSTGAPIVGAQDWYIGKSHSGQTGATLFPAPGSTGASAFRNQIIHEEKGLVGSGDGTAMAFKGVIVVPKGMRRMREGDEWFINLRNNDAGTSSQFCVKAIYKSFK